FMAFRPANWLFCLVVGALYWFLARGLRPSKLLPGLNLPARTIMGFLSLPQWLFLNPSTTNSFLVPLVVALCAVFAMFVNARASRTLTATWGILHGLAHVWLAASLIMFFAPYTSRAHRLLNLILIPPPDIGFYLIPTLYVLIAGLAG